MKNSRFCSLKNKRLLHMNMELQLCWRCRLLWLLWDKPHNWHVDHETWPIQLCFGQSWEQFVSVLENMFRCSIKYTHAFIHRPLWFRSNTFLNRLVYYSLHRGTTASINPKWLDCKAACVFPLMNICKTLLGVWSHSCDKAWPCAQCWSGHPS